MNRNNLYYFVLFMSAVCLMCVVLVYNKSPQNTVIESEVVLPQSSLTEDNIEEIEETETDSNEYNFLFQGKEYKGINLFWGEKDDEYLELPYIDENAYEILKKAYDDINFHGEFLRGNLDVYDTYKEKFGEMLHNEIPFLNKKTGEEIYCKDLEELEGFTEYDLKVGDFEYYFFDMDEDDAPELVIRVRHLYWLIFRYDPEMEKCVLWYTGGGGWFTCFGSRKVALFWDARDGFFWQLSKDGEVECEVNYRLDYYSVEESLLLFSLPVYADKQKEIILTDELKNQGVFIYSENKWFFRVTEQQCEELSREYIKASEEADININKVEYTYEELFGR